MPWLIDVRQRRRQPEIMDQPDIDPKRHVEALCCLERVNWVSRSAAILWPAIRRLANGPLRLLDVATGAGDIPVTLWKRSQRAGIALEIEGCDVSETALNHARQNARRFNAPIHFFEHDALQSEFPRQYDIVVCSLFLHHLEPDEAVTVLRRMADAARLAVLINDLNRSVFGWWLARLGTVLMSRSPVARVDGPRSVEGAWKPSEALDLAHRAGLDGAAVAHRWPCRWLLTWHRPNEGRA